MTVDATNLRAHAARLVECGGAAPVIGAAIQALTQAANYIDTLETTVRDAHALLAPALTVDAEPTTVDTPTG